MNLTYEQFKTLSRPEYDEFMSKLAHAVNVSEGAYQHATQIMKISLKQISYADFVNLPKPEHDELISIMFQNVLKNEEDFECAHLLVEAAQECGLYDKITFGPEVEKKSQFPIPDIIGLTPLS